MTDTLDACARELLDVMPLVMQDLRQTMRSHRVPGLRVPELRSLAFLRHSPGSNLTDLAEYIGVSLPSMSKLVDALALRGLLDRQADPGDRRRVRLFLTEDGLGVLMKAREAVKAGFTAKLAQLGPDEVAKVTMGLGLLHGLFAGRPADAVGIGRGAPQPAGA